MSKGIELQTTSKNLKSGYYWIKKFKNTDWEIAYFDKEINTWLFIGHDMNDMKPVLINPMVMKKVESKTSKHEAIYLALSQLGIGDTFIRDEFIQNHWGDLDPFIKRSFDAMFVLAKKRIEKEDIDRADDVFRSYKTITGNVKRLT